VVKIKKFEVAIALYCASLLLDRLTPPQYNPEQAFYGMKEKKE
jgi:hypothetical protein